MNKNHVIEMNEGSSEVAACESNYSTLS